VPGRACRDVPFRSSRIAGYTEVILQPRKKNREFIGSAWVALVCH
jgi:hypothetical protein